MGAITVEDGGVELIRALQLDDRGLKEPLIRAIFGPAIVPFVDVGVMAFSAFGFELSPLHAGRQDIQNIVQDVKEREFGLWPLVAPMQMRVDRPIEVTTRDFRGNLMKDEGGMYGGAVGIHRPVLPDEGGLYEPQKYPVNSLILPYL
jgi:hypothetical protein